MSYCILKELTQFRDLGDQDSNSPGQLLVDVVIWNLTVMLMLELYGEPVVLM